MTPITSRLAPFLVTGAVAIAFATGCGNGDDDDTSPQHTADAGGDAATSVPTGTTFEVGCDSTSSDLVHTCVDYQYLTADQEASLQSSCAAMGGRVISNALTPASGGACVEDGSVGSCEVATGSNVKQFTEYYSDDGYTAAQAEAACTAANGAFKS